MLPIPIIQLHTLRDMNLKYILVLLAFLPCINLTAQWHPMKEPSGGSSTSFATIGSIVFSGSAGGGVYLSADSGRTWTPVNNGLTDGHVFALAADDSILYAGTWTSGIFVSTDKGIHWTPANNGIETQFITSIAVKDTSIFAGATKGGGMFRSTDGGSTWTSINTGITNKNILSIFINDHIIYAGTGAGGFLSRNNGDSWTSLGTGIPGSSSIHSFTKKGNMLLAGTSNGVYFSNDSGNHWTAASISLSNKTIISLAADSTTIYAGSNGEGIFRSTTDVTSWTLDSIGPEVSMAIMAITIKGPNILAGLSSGFAVTGGIYTSNNKGMSWSLATGFTNTIVRSFCHSGSKVYAAVTGGVYCSEDTGDNWTTIRNGLGKNPDITSVAAYGKYLFAGNSGKVFVSADSGANWTLASSSLPNLNANLTVNALEIKDSTIFLGYKYYSGFGGVYISKDKGVTWTCKNNGFTRKEDSTVTSINILGNLIFIGTYGGGVFVSTNNGDVWTRANNGLSGTGLFIDAMTISGNAIFVATGAGVFMTTNNGNNWVARSNTDTSFNSLVSTGNMLLGGSYESGISVSSDSGNTWSSFNTGLSFINVRSLGITEHNIYAGTSWGGIWKRALKDLVCQPMLSSQIVTACDSYISPSGQLLTSSGIYGDTLQSKGGCDSIITTYLSINHPDTTVARNGLSLVAVDSNAAYQWLDCNNGYNAIPGQTSKIFSPTNSGNYALRITKNNCSDTSSCHNITVAGLYEESNQNSFHIYPNPTEGIVFIETNSRDATRIVTVTDQFGRTILENDCKESTRILLDNTVKPGVYTIRIKTSSGTIHSKILKQ